MHRLSIHQFRYVADTQQFVPDEIAVFRVTADGVTLERGEGEAYALMRVPDPETGASIGAEPDPVRWARLMESYLEGDVRATFEQVAGGTANVDPPYRLDPDAALVALHALVTPSQ